MKETEIHSLLNKNYSFIADTLSRNIGNIEYNAEYGNNMGNVAVIHNNKPLTDYATTIRNNFANYIEYAQSLNPELTFFNTTNAMDFYGADILSNSKMDIMYQHFLANRDGLSIGAAIKNELNSILTDIGNAATDADYVKFTHAYDTLGAQSERYISYVNEITNERNVNGAYQFGKGNVYGNGVVVPHQLTNGYSYSSMKGDLYGGISALNNISEVENIDVRIGGIYGNLEKPTKDNIDYNNLTHSELSSIIQNTNIDGIKGRYGKLLNSNKYFESIVKIDENGSDVEYGVRYIFNTNIGFTNTKLGNFSSVYSEAPDDTIHDSFLQTMSDSFGLNNSMYASMLDVGLNDLVSITNRNFRNGKYGTLIARFGSSANTPSSDSIKKDEYSEYHTAVSKYGTSHGRNLLKHDGYRKFSHSSGDDYQDPYCRVWTNYHQYTHVRNLIRPFSTEDSNGNATLMKNDELYSNKGFDRFRSYDEGLGNGHTRLHDYGVLDDNGFVNITPKMSDGGKDFATETKKCMFSIENLAWKGAWQIDDEVNGISKEQQGPFGGRIMWFPPYGLTFSESVTANWNSTQFIGRGEPIMTYTDTTRSGNLSFILLIDHPSLLNHFDTNEQEDNFEQNGSEYDILRFFAGCGTDYKLKQESKEEDEKKENLDDKKLNEKPNESPENNPREELFSFLAFFPNNYSGKDDRGGIGQNSGGDDPRPYHTSVDPITYLINGFGAQAMNGLDGETMDFPTNNNKKSYIDSESLIGYEMNCHYKLISNKETSSVTFEEPTKETSGISYYSYEELKDKNNIPYKNGKYLLPIKSGNKSLKNAMNRWWHRVDYKYADQNLYLNATYPSNAKGYMDLRSFGLNSSKGFDFVKQRAKDYGITDTNKLYTLSEVFLASTFKDYAQADYLIDYVDQTRYNYLLQILDKVKKDKISLSVETKGYASSQGTSKLNVDLANDRATTLKEWCETIFANYKIAKSEFIKIPYEKSEEAQKKSKTNYDESELEAKLGRVARVTFYASKSSVSNKAEDNSESDDLTVRLQTEETKKDKVDNKNVGNIWYSEQLKAYDVSDNNKTTRYDNEYEFFKKIDINDSFIRNKIVEKVKYFDPAYHSISPEGFNARLTFLHQCTRQGPTCGNSDFSTNKTATNLAFGKQPICILRIGDFYYTKIAINSLNIEYSTNGGLTWDLNPEGAGVQPMFARINLGFQFLGGSDLNGPIARLQNAVSFNYYANTSVYDNRAESAEYDDKGKMIKYKTFNPLGEKITNINIIEK